MGHDKRRRNRGLGEARCLGTHGQVRITHGGEWRAPLLGWTKGPEFSLESLWRCSAGKSLSGTVEIDDRRQQCGRGANVLGKRVFGASWGST